METKQAPILNVKADDESGMIVLSGIANKVGIVDLAGDKTLVGAFDDTVKSNPIVPAFYQHNPTKTIGLARLSISPDGDLLASIELTKDGNLTDDIHKITNQFAKAGRPMQMSIGYSVKDSAWVTIDKQYIYELKKVDVREVSVVSVAANQESDITEVRQKSLNDFKSSQKSISETEKLRKELIAKTKKVH